MRKNAHFSENFMKTNTMGMISFNNTKKILRHFYNCHFNLVRYAFEFDVCTLRRGAEVLHHVYFIFIDYLTFITIFIFELSPHM